MAGFFVGLYEVHVHNQRVTTGDGRAQFGEAAKVSVQEANQ